VCTIALDVKDIILPLLVFDSLGLFIESPFLSPIVSPSPQDNLGSAEHLNHHVEWKLRDDVEWSVDVESKILVETLSFSLSFLVKIKNLPSLVGTVMSIVDSYSLAFLICVTRNIKASVG
jgi:hypothetical protein